MSAAELNLLVRTMRSEIEEVRRLSKAASASLASEQQDVWGRWIVPPAAKGFNWRLFPFAPALSGASVTIGAGEVLRGMRPAITVAEATHTVEADTWVTVALSLADDTAETVFLAAPPASDAATYRRALYKIELADGSARLAAVFHLGAIHLPGVTA